MQERPKFQLSDDVRICDKGGIVHIHIRCGGVLLVLIGFHFPALNNAYAIFLNISYYRVPKQHRCMEKYQWQPIFETVQATTKDNV